MSVSNNIKYTLTVDGKMTEVIESSELEAYKSQCKKLVEALESTIEPLEWWTNDYPNGGKYTDMSYDTLIKIRDQLAAHQQFIKGRV